LSYIFDACALIAFLDEEKGEGYEAVAELFDRAVKEDLPRSQISQKSKSRKKKRIEAPNFPERMAKTAQVLNNLNDKKLLRLFRLCG
jgi:hypothetical protein